MHFYCLTVPHKQRETFLSGMLASYGTDKTNRMFMSVYFVIHLILLTGLVVVGALE